MKIKDAYRKLEEIQSDVIWWKAGAQSHAAHLHRWKSIWPTCGTGAWTSSIEGGHPLEMVLEERPVRYHFLGTAERDA